MTCQYVDDKGNSSQLDHVGGFVSKKRNLGGRRLCTTPKESDKLTIVTCSHNDLSQISDIDHYATTPHGYMLKRRNAILPSLKCNYVCA